MANNITDVTYLEAVVIKSNGYTHPNRGQRRKECAYMDVNPEEEVKNYDVA